MRKIIFVFTFICCVYLVQNTVIAQEFNFTKARADYIFTEDTYRTKLTIFNLKRDSYQKNPTLSLKEEARVALLDFLKARNDLIKNYLTLLRIKTLESDGLTIIEKQDIFTKIDPEVEWFSKRKDSYSQTETLENLIVKSKEEDTKYKDQTLSVIYYSLSTISLGEVVKIKNDHIDLYTKLKLEANSLIALGRSDSSLFDRWFRDIDGELAKIDTIEKETKIEINKILSENTFERGQSYQNAIETLDPVKSNLLQLNQFVKELETTINTKR